MLLRECVEGGKHLAIYLADEPHVKLPWLAIST
jgi:hypothetical protein